MPQITFALYCPDQTVKSIVQTIVDACADIDLVEINKPIQDAVGEDWDIVLFERENVSSNEIESILKPYPNLTGIVLCPNTIENKEQKKQIPSDWPVEFLFKKNTASNDDLVHYFQSFFSGFLSLYRTQRNLRSIQTPSRNPITKQQQKPFDLLAIASSTGGPDALKSVIPHLPGKLGVPVLIVQHMPPEFTANLANNLNSNSELSVTEATDDGIIEKNTVYIAPGGMHMKVKRLHHPTNGQVPLKLQLTMEPPVNNCRPSADVLFTSLAKEYNGNILTIVLTGMGVDGREGVKALKNLNTYCITQHKDSCVVYGMPKAVAEAGLSNEVVPLPKIAERISALLRH